MITIIMIIVFYNHNHNDNHSHKDINNNNTYTYSNTGGNTGENRRTVLFRYERLINFLTSGHSETRRETQFLLC